MTLRSTAIKHRQFKGYISPLYARHKFHLPVGGAGDDLNAEVVPVLNGRARLSHLVQQREATHCQSGLVQHGAAARKQQVLEMYGSFKWPLGHLDDCFILMIQTADCG